MARTTWKHTERAVARHLDGKRYPANQGGRVDVESPRHVAQVKNVRTLSLAAIEALAIEMAQLGKLKGKAGLVVIKRSAGVGRSTPFLVVLTLDQLPALDIPEVVAA